MENNAPKTRTNLKAICAEQDITFTQLANDIGLDRVSISRIASGDANPSLATLEAICLRLGRDASEIFPKLSGHA